LSIEKVVELGQGALMMVLLLSSPMLILGLLVGLAVSIFQATTQIQEATLSFIPKIVAVLLAFAIFGPWLISLAVDYTRELFLSMNEFIR
jgi:flagellar biosynthetic protein FliQ